MKTQNEFHQNGCSVWLLGCKVEQCKNVSLINTANGDSHCSGRRALLLQDTVGEYQDAKQLQCCNSLLGVSILESPRKHFRGDLKRFNTLSLCHLRVYPRVRGAMTLVVVWTVEVLPRGGES